MEIGFLSLLIALLFIVVSMMILTTMSSIYLTQGKVALAKSYLTGTAILAALILMITLVSFVLYTKYIDTKNVFSIIAILIFIMMIGIVLVVAAIAAINIDVNDIGDAQNYSDILAIMCGIAAFADLFIIISYVAYHKYESKDPDILKVERDIVKKEKEYKIAQEKARMDQEAVLKAKTTQEIKARQAKVEKDLADLKKIQDNLNVEKTKLATDKSIEMLDLKKPVIERIINKPLPLKPPTPKRILKKLPKTPSPNVFFTPPEFLDPLGVK
jgi:hypothetical protein